MRRRCRAHPSDPPQRARRSPRSDAAPDGGAPSSELACLPWRSMGEVRELREASQEAELDHPDRPVAVLAQDQFCNAQLVRLLSRVVLVAVDEEDEIRVLLDRAGV